MKTIFRIRFIIFLVLFFIYLPVVQANILINLLTWEGYAPAEQVRFFEQLMTRKYSLPVHFNVTYVSSESDYINAINNGEGDVIAPSHNIFKDYRYKLIDKQLILPINIKNIPNYTKIFPDLQYADYSTIKGAVYSVPLVHGPYGLAYNSNLVQPEPDSWKVFWEPKFKGRYTINSDYSEVNIYITALALGVRPKDLNKVSKLSNPVLVQKLTLLIKQAGNLWYGVDKASDLEHNLIGAAWGFSFPALAKKGQVWKMASPKEGTTRWIDGHAISKNLADKPLHKKIAEDWINYTLSEAFQLKVIARGIASAPVNITIKNQLTADEIDRFHFNDENYFSKKQTLWPTLSKTQRRLMKLLWDKALTNANR